MEEEEVVVAAAAKAGEGDRDGAEEEEEEEEEREEEEEGGEETECSICLLGLEAGAEGQEVLVCSHAYHTRCLDAWRERCRGKEVTLTCPYCRREM
jgi:hypothetical protein